jgi:transposase
MSSRHVGPIADRDGDRGQRARPRRRQGHLEAAAVRDAVAGAHLADGGYAGKLIAYARKVLRLVVEVVRRKDGQRGFEVLPRRWVIERTLSWIMRCRRLVCDYERLPVHSEAMVTWAMIGVMTRRLAPTPGRRPWEPATPK